ncbi:restriction endonuclease [Pseudidiomarina aestuarii]|uniref:Restriction endonuclease n=1 Tax=Pseudidiomarina aestuarii TaxID=624146 RepID=A0A7Z6ZSS5_9GAMM|nr:restriction endonuclease [Pseudidiomarina aestuarii]RUO39452.1 restriction endonuclease [Pseudidiomarina aestuarii]
MARRKSTGEELLELFSLMPWYICLILALALHFGVDVYVSMSAPDTELKASPQLASSVISNMFGNIVLLLSKWALPFLLIIAAFGSFMRSKRQARVYDGIKSAQYDESISKLSWRNFEVLVGEFFRRDGYIVYDTGKGKDGGVDLRVIKDGQLYLVQCKHWQQLRVPVNVVRELFGVMISENADGVFIVASGSMTKDAKEFAQGKRIEVIDGKKLRQFFEQQQQSKERYRFVPTSVETREKHSCPICGGEMTERVAKRGPRAGQKFLGCLKYPNCRGIVNL